jgi:hypothetical protein
VSNDFDHERRTLVQFFGFELGGLQQPQTMLNELRTLNADQAKQYLLLSFELPSFGLPGRSTLGNEG